MSATTHDVGAGASADRDTLQVAVLAGFALASASALLLTYGSFARMLAAFGLAPVG